MRWRKIKVRVYLALAEYTSAPLLIGLLLLYLSGYCLTTTKVARLTLGLLMRRECILLHTGVFPYLVGILAMLHALGGFGLMINRRIRNDILRIILELANLIIVGVVFLIQLTILALA